MYKTKGEITTYAFGTGEKGIGVSNTVIPWNKETDDWYDLSEEDKKDAYLYTCAKIAYLKNHEQLLNTLSTKELFDLSNNYRLVFNYVDREYYHIPNAELVMMFRDGETDRHNFFPAWVSLNDLKKTEAE